MNELWTVPSIASFVTLGFATFNTPFSPVCLMYGQKLITSHLLTQRLMVRCALWSEKYDSCDSEGMGRDCVRTGALPIGIGQDRVSLKATDRRLLAACDCYKRLLIMNPGFETASLLSLAWSSAKPIFNWACSFSWTCCLCA